MADVQYVTLYIDGITPVQTVVGSPLYYMYLNLGATLVQTHTGIGVPVPGLDPADPFPQYTTAAEAAAAAAAAAAGVTPSDAAVAALIPGDGLTAAALRAASGAQAIDPASPLRQALDEVYNGTLAPLSHLTDNDPHGDRAYTAAELALLVKDPLRLGPVCFPPGVTATQQAWPTANDARFVRLLGAGTISKVGLQIGTSSGNVSVGVYAGTGVGRNRQPGTRLATSGTVACPAAGYQEIALGSTVDVVAGDFLAFACDNTTANFLALNGSTNNLYAGLSYGQASSLALPATAAGAPTGARVPLLVGSA